MENNYRNIHMLDETIEKIKDKLESKYGKLDDPNNNLDYSSIVENYRGLMSVYKLKCKIHGEFFSNAVRVLPGPNGIKVPCPKCNEALKKAERERVLVERRKRKLQRARDAVARVKDYPKYDGKGDKNAWAVRKYEIMMNNPNCDFSKSLYTGVEDYMEIVCKLHGPFKIKPHSIAKGGNCPMCSRNNRYDPIRITIDELERIIKERYGDKYKLKRDTFTVASNNFVVVCEEHGPFITNLRTIRSSGCRKCFIERDTLTSEEFIAKSKKLFPNMLTYDKVVYTGSKNKVTLTCKTHGDFDIIAGEHLRKGRRRYACPICTSSNGEKLIHTLLRDAKIKFTRQWSFQGSRYKFDFHIKKTKILIEYDGEQHFKPVDWYGGVEGYRKRVKSDKAKALLAKKNGYEIMRFAYYDTNAYIEEQLYKYLRASKLGIESFEDKKSYNAFYNVKSL